MIKFKNFSFRYEERDQPALKDINLEIGTGEFILLTGRSGCGKTTFLRCLNGLVPHFYPGEIKGGLELDSKSLLEMRPSQLAGSIGTVFQDPRSQFFMTDTTRELAFGCENLGLLREETISRVEKAAAELRLTGYLNRSIFNLSSGEKQQIAIGSVYALSPMVYIFDEPSANLDYAATMRLAGIMEQLKRNGYTIIVVEHRFYYLRDLIDRAILIEDGCIINSFSRSSFLALDEGARIRYGLRTVYPEKVKAGFAQVQGNSGTVHTLSCGGISFYYKRNVKILDSLSFEAKSGEVISITGHNGTGKTTLISILTGLIRQKSGQIIWDGRILPAKRRRKLCYLVMQDADYQLFSSSVEEELSLGIDGDRNGQVKRTLEALELKKYSGCHPASLSGGQKQRVTIGAAIVKESPVLCFDEPTSGLDYESMLRVSSLITGMAKRGAVIFIVSHDFEFIARTCTRTLQIGKGEESYVQ